MAKVKAKSKSKTKLKIKKDDDVIVISGRDRGKRGKVLRVLPAKKRVLVQGVAMARRHVKPTQTDPQGGIVEREATIHLSNVALVDPRSDLPTRAGYMVLEGGRKVRFAKRSGEVIDV